MGAGWIAQGADSPAPTGADAPVDPWKPIAPDTASVPALVRPHQDPTAHPVDNTRGLLTRTHDLLFGHEPDNAQDTDQAHVAGVLPALGASLADSASTTKDFVNNRLLAPGPSASALATAYPHLFGADVDKFKAGVEETVGAQRAQSAQRQVAALTVLPQVADRVFGPGGGAPSDSVPGMDMGADAAASAKYDLMAKDPLVAKTARSLGISPQAFAADWRKYAGQSPEQLADQAARAKDTMDQGNALKATGTAARNQAWADQRAWQPSDLEHGGLDPWSLKGMAFNFALGAPQMAAITGAAVGGTALGGPGLGLAAGGATAAALMTPGQREDIKDKIDDQVSSLLEKADHVDAVAPVGQKRGMNPYSEQLRQQAATLEASSDPIANTAGLFYGVSDVAGAVPVSAVLSRSPVGKAMLDRMVGSALAKTVGGRIAGNAVANGAGGALQAAIQKGVDTGIVHEDTSLSAALKDIAYAGITTAITTAPFTLAHEAFSRTPSRDTDSSEFMDRVKSATQDYSSSIPKGYLSDATTTPESRRLAGGEQPTGAPAGPSGSPGGDAGGAAAATGGQTGPAPAAPASAGAKREAYQDKLSTLHEAAAAAEKRSDVTLEPEEEGWSVHVKGQPVATFDTVEAAREAVAQARKVVGTKPAVDETNPPETETEGPSAGTTVPETTQSAREPETALERTQPVQSERRSDMGLRQRVEDMSPEQMKAALLTHELTGIPNLRAYNDSDKKATQVSVDADSLKWFNTQGSHAGGDQLIRAIATAMHEQSPGNAYHKGGDEFVLQADSPQEAESHMAAIKQRLAGARIDMTAPDGRTLTVKGIGVTHGIGKDFESADRAMEQEKAQRTASGLRAGRDQQPPGATFAAPEAGLPSDQRHPAAQEVGPSGAGEVSKKTISVLGQDVPRPAVPTTEQARTGNYFQPTVQWHGLPIKVENAKGSRRTYMDGKTGRPATRVMKSDYGYVNGTKGADGDGVDVVMGPHHDSGKAFVVDQLDHTGNAFDEHKVILGARSEEEARHEYLQNYQAGWKGLGGITEVSPPQLKRWLTSADLTKPIDPESVPGTKSVRGMAPDARHDSVLQYLARHPRGLDREEASSHGIDTADMGSSAAHVGIRKAFRKGGMSFDHAAETLHQSGYPVTDEEGHYSPNVLLDRVADELRGHPHYSSHNEAHLPQESDHAPDWRQPLSDHELAALTVAQARERLDLLAKEQDRLEREIERAGLNEDSAHETADELERIPFQRKEGGQQDLFGDRVAVRNEIKRLEAALDKKRSTGQESVETGKADDLFSEARKQLPLQRPAEGGSGVGDRQALTMSPMEIHFQVADMLKNFAHQPEVVIARDLDEIKHVPDVAAALKDTHDGDVIAFVHGGKIYLVADQFHSPSDVASAIAHEYITHYGLRAAFGSRQNFKYQAILDGVARAMPAEMRTRGEREFPDGFNPLNAHQRNVAAEETLAYYGQRYAQDQSVPAQLKRWLDKLHGMIRDWVRSVMGLPKKFDELFVKRTLADLESYLRRGSTHARANSESDSVTAPKRPAFAGPEDTFFSGLAKAVDAAKREKGTGAEWQATLRNMAGVKAEELQWTGLKDWLEGRGRVTKAEVAEYVAAHRVQLGEVEHGGAGTEQPALSTEDLDHVSAWMQGHGLEPFAQNGEEERALLRGGPEAADVVENLHRYGFPVADLPTAISESSATKFHTYSSPGGKNYRELLMTLPQKPSRLPTLEEWWKQTHVNSLEASMADPRLREIALRAYERDKKNLMVSPNYQSPHWEEPNVLAHIRFDDRTGPNGEKVLHVAEVQSDWHQQGRKQGYAVAPTQARRDAIRQRLISIVGDMNRAEKGSGEWHSLLLEENELKDELEENKRLPPDAPFKTTWPDLAMKRMLRYAAERGYDALSWDTGATNADRYNLRKQVERVSYDPDTKHLVAIDKYANKVLNQEGVEVAKLPDYIGKEAAERLLATERTGGGYHTLTGPQLEIGGDGMKAFYDKMLPATVGKLVKKWGSGVESALVNGEGETAQHYVGPIFTRQELLDFLKTNGTLGSDHRQELADVLSDLAQGRNFSASMTNRASDTLARALGGRIGGVPMMIPSHIVRITPAMRDSVMQGQPMFLKRRKGSTGAPPPVPKKGAYDLARRAVAAIPNSEFAMSLRRIADPSTVSPPARATALVAREAFGELAQASEEALQNLERFAKTFDLLGTEDRFAFIHSMETGAPQANQELQPAADAIRKLLDGWREQIRSLGTGALDNFIENYFPHIWADDAKAKKAFGQIFGRRPLKGPATFLKERTIPTTREGLALGLKPISTNPLILAFAKLREMQRFYTGVKLMQRFKDEKLAVFLPSHKLMPDGWKEIDDAVGRVRQWSETEQGFIERGKYIMPTDAARVINNHLGASALRNFLPAQIFRTLSNAANALQLGFSAFHLGFTTLDAVISKNAVAIERMLHGEPLKAGMALLEGLGAGAPMNLVRGNRLLKAYANVGGATPEMRRIVEGLMAGGGRVKMDNYYQAAQGLSPFKGVGFATLAHDVKAALTQPHDKVWAATQVLTSFPHQYATRLWRDLVDMTHTLSWPWLSVPLEVAGRMTRASTSIIMEHIVPLQKLGVFSDLAADHIRRNPLEDPVAFAGAMQKIWNSVDNRLGEMVYDNVFWNRTFKEVNHMMVRAVGWNLGTVRELGGAPIDAVKVLDYVLRGAPAEGQAPDLTKTAGERQAYEEAKGTLQRIAEKVGHKIPYTLALISTTMLLGAILTKLFSGKDPEEPKDYFFPWTGRYTKYGTKERISMPSYTKDLVEYGTQPMTTIINKANPIFGIVHAIYANEDFFGNPVRNPDDPMWKQMLEGANYGRKEVMPFSFQGGKQFAGAGELDAKGKTLTALPYVGFGPAPARVTSPEEMERYQKRETEKGWIRGLSMQLKKAQAAGDTAEVDRLRDELRASKLQERDTERAIKQQTIKGRELTKPVADAAKKISSLVSGRSRTDAVAALRQAGLPAFAALWHSLPDRPKARVAESLESFAAGEHA